MVALQIGFTVPTVALVKKDQYWLNDLQHWNLAMDFTSSWGGDASILRFLPNLSVSSILPYYIHEN
jgi:hypothetical protein